MSDRNTTTVSYTHLLTDHRVDDEEDLVGGDRVADVAGLRHEIGVDGQAAGGVDDDDVVQRLAGLVEPEPRDGDRVAIGPVSYTHLDVYKRQ